MRNQSFITGIADLNQIRILSAYGEETLIDAKVGLLEDERVKAFLSLSMPEEGTNAEGNSKPEPIQAYHDRYQWLSSAFDEAVDPKGTLDKEKIASDLVLATQYNAFAEPKELVTGVVQAVLDHARALRSTLENASPNNNL